MAPLSSVPLKDTPKRVSAAGTVKPQCRESVYGVSRPHKPFHALLRRAFQHAWRQGLQVTDEAGLIEALDILQIVPS
jgi:2-C-methyl-D-erythritol 4-phosphate cytidylyltransferase